MKSHDIRHRKVSHRQKNKVPNEALIEVGKHYLSYRLLLRSQIKEVAFTAMNLLFLANGGAVVAALSFLGAAFGSKHDEIFIGHMQQISNSIRFYVYGLWAVIGSMIAMYIIYEIQLDVVSGANKVMNFMSGKAGQLDEGRRSAQWPDTTTNWKLRISWLLHGPAVLSCTYSAYCFGIGSIELSKIIADIPVY